MRPTGARMGDLLTPLALLVLGYLLLGVEVAILPGFGLPGLLGIASLAGGSYMLWHVAGPLVGTIGILASLGAAVAAAIWFARSRTGRRLVLADQIDGVAAPTEQLAACVGRRGDVVADLRPSGVVRVDGDRHDAILQDGTWLPSGAAVRVVGQEHGQLLVVADE
jgi:membrane-bound serine protease (ClpP class)